MARRTRLYFATDLHGSSKCFRKFLNAGPTYGADVLILGADLAGKAIQGIVRGADGRYRCRFIGTDHDVAAGAELEALEKLVEDHGYYPVRAEPGELEARQAEGTLDAVFLEAMAARLRSWLALADERLRPRGIPLYVMLGNDDPVALRPILEEPGWAIHAEGRALPLDDDHELISWGYSNLTPFHSHREQTEAELDASIRAMVGGLREPSRAVFNLHVPPLGSGLDDAPVLDADLTVQASLGQVRFAPAGSSAVRDLELEVQPLLGLHGHIHESAGIRRLGRTIAINPGSDYGTGTLNGALVTLERDKVATHQLVRG
jgi:Icc-related predicted phosphoesterase